MKQFFCIFALIMVSLSSVIAEDKVKEKVQNQIESILKNKLYQKKVLEEAQERELPEIDMDFSGFLFFEKYIYFAFIGFVSLILVVVVLLAIKNIVITSRNDIGFSNKKRFVHPLENEEITLGQSQDLGECRRILKKALQVLFKSRCIYSEKYLTNLEIIKSLPVNSPFKEPLQTISDVIERGYYAKKDITFEDYKRCLESLNIIQRKIENLSRSKH